MAQDQQLKDATDKKQTTLQTGAADASNALQASTQPHYPAWPTSSRGPQSTPPPLGTKAINAIRREQVCEIGYNQETGEPATQSPLPPLFDATSQPETAQEALKRRKHRIE